MNDAFLPSSSDNTEAGTTREMDTLGSSTLYKLCEEVIALREYDKRQLRLVEQTLNKVRDELKTSFNSFAADTQRAYQQLRQELHGEKRVSFALLNELIGRHPGTVARRKRRDAEMVARAALCYRVPRAAGPRRVGLTISGRYGTFPDPVGVWKSLLDALARSGLIVDDAAEWCRCERPVFLRGPRFTVIELTDL